jgi:hypothetical protein
MDSWVENPWNPGSTLNYPTIGGSMSTPQSTNWGSAVTQIVHKPVGSNSCYWGGPTIYGLCWYHVRPYWWKVAPLGPLPSAFFSDSDFNEDHSSRVPQVSVYPIHSQTSVTATQQYDGTNYYQVQTTGKTLVFYLESGGRVTVVMTKTVGVNDNMSNTQWFYPQIIRV